MKVFICKWVIIPFLFFVLAILVGCIPVARGVPNQQPPLPSPVDSEPGQPARMFALIAPPTVSDSGQPTQTLTPIPSPTVSDPGQPTQTFTSTASRIALASPTGVEPDQPTQTSTPTASRTASASPTFTATTQPTGTAEPSPTFCPVPTQELLWVEPVTSPTNELSQVIVVGIGYGEEVSVVTESGTFTVTGNFISFRVEVPLLPNTAHHLEVIAKVRKVPGWNGCIYGGYTLRTTRDGKGAPLTIVQGEPIPQKPGGIITVDNASRLEQLTSFAPNARFVTDFVFSQNNEVISVGYDSNISVWSTETGKEVRQIGSAQASALAVAINSNGSLVATDGTVDDPSVRLWNIQTGEMNQLGTHQPYPMSIAFNPNNTRLASGGNADTVTIWDVDHQQSLITFKGDVPGRLQSFSSLYWKDDYILVAGGSDAIYWWDTTTGSLLQRLAKPAEAVFFVDAAFSQNSDRVAAAAQDAYVYYWDRAVDKWSRWPAPPNSSLTNVSFSPDGQLLVAGTDKGQMLIWDVETQQLLAQYSTTSSSLAAIRFSPGGLYIASGGWDGPIRLWGIPSP